MSVAVHGCTAYGNGTFVLIGQVEVEHLPGQEGVDFLIEVQDQSTTVNHCHFKQIKFGILPRAGNKLHAVAFAIVQPYAVGAHHIAINRQGIYFAFFQQIVVKA